VKRQTEASFSESVKIGIQSSGSSYLQKLCRDLMNLNSRYNWVGIYVLNGDKLVLNSYAGERTEHEQISLGDGLCSQAIVQDAIVNESDVKSNSKYLACFINTRSELVVPVRFDSKPVGEIDIDSDTKRAFDREDELFISEIAELISETVGSLAK